MITLSDFKINLKKRLKVSIFLTNFALAVGLGLTLIQPFLYKTNFSIFLVQDSQKSTDVYSTVESSDKLVQLLEKVIKTSDFQNAVLDSSNNFNISSDDFDINEAKKRKEWNNMIKTNVVPSTGILNVDVYFKNKLGSEEYAKAIINQIVNNGADIYGGSDLISFRVINSPLTSEKPASPNIVLNIILSLFIGLFISFIYVYFTTIEIKKVDVFYDEELEKQLEERKNIQSNLNNSIKSSTSKNFVENIKSNNIEVEPKEETLKREDLKVFEQEQENNSSLSEVEFLKDMNNRVKSVFDDSNIKK